MACTIWAALFRGVSTYEHPLDEQYRTYYRQIRAKNDKEAQYANVRRELSVSAGTVAGGV